MRSSQSLTTPSRGGMQPANLPQGFQLSPHPMEPSEHMQGNIPNLLRAQRQAHHYDDNIGASFDRLMPFDNTFSMMPHRGFSLDNFFPSPGFMNPHMMQESSMQVGGNQSGVYKSSTMVMTSVTGKDGKQHVERYKKSAVGDYGKDMHEVKEAYSNSGTKKDVMAMERRKQNRGIQMIRHRDNNTEVMEETQMPINMNEEDVEEFNNTWYNELGHLQHQQLHSNPSGHRLYSGAERRQLQ